MNQIKVMKFFEFDPDYYIDREMTEEDWKTVEMYIDDNIDCIKHYEAYGFNINDSEVRQDYISYLKDGNLMSFEDFVRDIYYPEFIENCKAERDYRNMIYDSYNW